MYNHVNAKIINHWTVKMPQDTLSFIQRIQEYGLFGYAWILFLSLLAGTTRYIISLDGKKPSFFGWCAEMIVSAFVGIIAAHVCHYANFDFLLTAAITGICAHNGTRSLYIISEIIKKNSSFKLEPNLTKAESLRRRSDKDGNSK